MRLEHQQTFYMVPVREDLQSPAARCLSTLGTSRNTRALSHPIAYTGSMLAGCNSLASSVNLCLQWTKACQHPCSTQPSLVPQRTAAGGTASQDFTFFAAAALPQTLGKAFNTVPNRCPLLHHIPTSSTQPSGAAALNSVRGSLQPGCQCRARARPSQ